MITYKKFIPVMITPFTDSGMIDFDALTKLTEYYLENGAGGLFANCQSSEMFDLSAAEKLQLVSHVVMVVNGRVPVVATGNFGSNIEAQAEFVKLIYSTGVEAVILLPNQLVKENESEYVLETNIMKLLSLTENIPVGFYECPVPYKVLISPDLLGRLAATSRVIYHKDTSLNIEEVTRKNANCAGNKDFGLYDAYMAHAVDSLHSGSAGLSCIQGNYFPELIAWLCKNYNQPGCKNEVQIIQQFFIDEMEVLHKHYPLSAKYYLQKKYLPITTYTRAKRNAVVPEEVKESMEGLQERFGKMYKKIEAVFAENIAH